MEISSRLNLNKTKNSEGEEIFELDFTTQAKGQEPWETDETGMSAFLTRKTALKLAWSIIRSELEPEKWEDESND